MTPKEKAMELLENYKKQVSMSVKDYSLVCKVLDNDMAKQCALIAVDEIMKAPHENQYIELIPSDADDTDWFWDKFGEYWKEVKQEIEKL